MIGQFKDHWSEAAFEVQSRSGPLFFSAQITYKSARRTVIGERADVRIQLSGYGTDGQLDIFDSARLNVQNFHLQISPSWGNYKLNKTTGELVYKGDSDKMGGEYTIRVLPVGEPENPDFC